MVLVLPGMFGVTMVGEGMAKVVHYQPIGWVHIFFGMLFMITVVMAYFYLGGIL